MTNPFLGIINTIAMFAIRKFEFDKNVVNKSIQMEDGEVFTIFRRVKVKTKATPGAYFLVRFQPMDMSPVENIKFSKKPMMVFMGFRGFRSKYWAVNYETGLCQGLYEWQTVKDAEQYSKSIAMKFMARRSRPESVSYRIIDKSKDSINFKII
jgi:hypothetical protein